MQLAVAFLVVAISSSCEVDMDCSLNGLCVKGSCVCDPPWSGAACEALSFAPAFPIAAYGMWPNVTSWGGNSVFHQGEWHLFVAEMVNGCGLSTWGTNSQIIHATSSTPTGPYRKRDVSLPPWSHNPHIVTRPINATHTQFVLFHIGPGDGKAETVNCSSYRRNESPRNRSMARNVWSADGDLVHTSFSPFGPWEAVQLPFWCNNPAPMFHAAHGMFYVLCNNGNWFIMSASALEGPWAKISDLPPNPPDTGVWEDPFLWVDSRGNWHALAHAYNNTTPCGLCDSPLVSGHYFSRDGLAWQASAEQPYSHLVEFTDGTSHVYSTRERPKILFDAAGVPTHLVTGVNPHTTCPPTPSVDCKSAAGIDWDYTLIQPFAAVPFHRPRPPSLH